MENIIFYAILCASFLILIVLCLIGGVILNYITRVGDVLAENQQKLSRQIDRKHNESKENSISLSTYERGRIDDIGDAIFATEKQAKSALAMALISQIIANDKRFGGVVTDEEYANENIWKHSINRRYNTIEKYSSTRGIEYFLSFHTTEQRDLFLKENEDLVKDYLMIE